MDAKLVVASGKANRSEIRLKFPLRIGRGREADLKIAHATVSRIHCELTERDGQIVVRDNGSTNGTFIDDVRITEAVLKPGSLLAVGPLTFRAEYEPADAQPAAKPTPAAAGTVPDLSTLRPAVATTLDVSKSAAASAPAAKASSDDDFFRFLEEEGAPSPARGEPAPDFAALEDTAAAAKDSATSTETMFLDPVGVAPAAAPGEPGASESAAPADKPLPTPSAASVAATDDDLFPEFFDGSPPVQAPAPAVKASNAAPLHDDLDPLNLHADPPVSEVEPAAVPEAAAASAPGVAAEPSFDFLNTEPAAAEAEPPAMPEVAAVEEQAPAARAEPSFDFLADEQPAAPAEPPASFTPPAMAEMPPAVEVEPVAVPEAAAASVPGVAAEPSFDFLADEQPAAPAEPPVSFTPPAMADMPPAAEVEPVAAPGAATASAPGVAAEPTFDFLNTEPAAAEVEPPAMPEVAAVEEPAPAARAEPSFDFLNQGAEGNESSTPPELPGVAAPAATAALEPPSFDLPAVAAEPPPSIVVTDRPAAAMPAKAPAAAKKPSAAKSAKPSSPAADKKPSGGFFSRLFGFKPAVGKSAPTKTTKSAKAPGASASPIAAAPDFSALAASASAPPVDESPTVTLRVEDLLADRSPQQPQFAPPGEEPSAAGPPELSPLVDAGPAVDPPAESEPAEFLAAGAPDVEPPQLNLSDSDAPPTPVAAGEEVIQITLQTPANQAAPRDEELDEFLKNLGLN